MITISASTLVGALFMLAPVCILAMCSLYTALQRRVDARVAEIMRATVPETEIEEPDHEACPRCGQSAETHLLVYTAGGTTTSVERRCFRHR